MCEVALGNMLELTEAKMISRLPKGKHSTMGLGRSQPDPEQDYVDANGAVIAMGKGKLEMQVCEESSLIFIFLNLWKGVKSGVEDATTLLYNEYIVYDTEQIRMKYLFRVIAWFDIHGWKALRTFL